MNKSYLLANYGVVRAPFTHIFTSKYLESKSVLVVPIDLALKMKHKLGKLNSVFKMHYYDYIDVIDGNEAFGRKLNKWLLIEF